MRPTTRLPKFTGKTIDKVKYVVYDSDTDGDIENFINCNIDKIKNDNPDMDITIKSISMTHVEDFPNLFRIIILYSYPESCEYPEIKEPDQDLTE